MSRPLVVLMRGHSATSLGTQHEGLVEYDLLPLPMGAMEFALRLNGVDVVRDDCAGTLLERQSRGAAAIARHRQRYPDAKCVYVSCHINSPGARAVVFHDVASEMGEEVATALGGSGGVYASLAVAAATPFGHEGQRNAYACIRHVYGSTPDGCCAVLVEFAAIDKISSGTQPHTHQLRSIGMNIGAELAKHLTEGL